MADAGAETLPAVLDAVRSRVSPSPAERDRVKSVVETALGRARDAVADLPVDADVVHVGSTARDTWLSGAGDVDVFLRLPTDCGRDDLEAYGARVGYAVLPAGREAYAEHPYVSGTIDGIEVDVVPCYRVDAATDARSAVDRTPFHSAYVADRLRAARDDGPDPAAEVRVCKAFLTAIGAYGSDLETRGFSGYLTELLVLEHGGVRDLFGAAADWQPPVRLDPESHGERSFDAPLAVVDPTDPDRNVAAVVSDRNVARFQHYARDLLTAPRTAAFEPPDRDPLSVGDVRDHLDRRGTTPVALRFDRPDVVDDQLYPQLRKSLDGLRSALDRRGFEPLRSATFADGERAVLLIELAVAERPAVERHAGPPVHVRDHADDFHATYADDPSVYGPFVDGDRYVVERRREFETAIDVLRSDAVFDAALGADVEPALCDADLLVGEGIERLADRFGDALRDYFDPRP